MAIVKCDECECTFDITRCEAKNPGGVVSGCPHDSEQCGIGQSIEAPGNAQPAFRAASGWIRDQQSACIPSASKISYGCRVLVSSSSSAIARIFAK